MFGLCEASGRAKAVEPLLRALGAVEDGTERVAGWAAELEASTERAAQAARKLALGWAAATAAGAAAQEALAKAVAADAERVFASVLVAAQGACRAIRNRLATLAVAFVRAWRSLLDFLANGSQEETGAVRRAAAVEESLLALKAVPGSNSAATGRNLVETAVLCAETIREFEMILAETPTQCGLEEGSELYLDDTEPEIGSDAWYAMMDHLVETQDEVVPADAERIRHGVDILKKCGRRIQRIAKQTNENLENDLGWHNRVFEISYTARDSILNFGMAMYPPHDESNWLKCSHAMSKSYDDFGRELPAFPLENQEGSPQSACPDSVRPHP